MVKVGFIGCGGIARAHLQRVNQVEGVKIVALCDIIKEKAEELGRIYGGNVYTDYHQMLDKEKIDALYICLIPAAHTDQAIIAAQKKIALYVEKPVCLDLQMAREANAVIEKEGVISSVGYQLRYMDIVQQARQVIGHKDIALLRGYYLSTFVAAPWWKKRELSGGQAVEQSTHIFDLARLFAGDAQKVYALAFQGLMKEKEGYDIDDASVVTIQFEKGTIGEVASTCILSQGWGSGLELVLKGMRLEIKLSGTLKISNERNMEVQSSSDSMMLADQAFIEAVKQKNPRGIKSNYADGLKTLELTLAASESMRSGKVIEIKNA